MSSLNRVLLMGNLTRDPVLRNLNAGSCVADFGLAMSEVVTSREGERDERVCFVEIVVWNAQAKACAEHLRKGARVFVEGKLILEEWNDKATGDKRSKLRVRADRVHFISSTHRPSNDEDLPAGDAPPASDARPRGRVSRPVTQQSAALSR